MKVELIQSLRRWFKREEGGALAELAILVPFLAVMVAGVCEFGRFFQNYTTLSKATRTASRYLSNHDLNPTEIGRAQSLMVCGKLACGVGDKSLVYGFTAGNVCMESTPESEGSAKIIKVTVRIPRTETPCSPMTGAGAATPFTYTPIFNIGALLNSPGLSLAFPIAPSTTMYYMID